MESVGQRCWAGGERGVRAPRERGPGVCLPAPRLPFSSLSRSAAPRHSSPPLSRSLKKRLTMVATAGRRVAADEMPRPVAREAACEGRETEREIGGRERDGGLSHLFDAGPREGRACHPRSSVAREGVRAMGGRGGGKKGVAGARRKLGGERGRRRRPGSRRERVIRAPARPPALRASFSPKPAGACRPRGWMRALCAGRDAPSFERPLEGGERTEQRASGQLERKKKTCGASGWARERTARLPPALAL